MRLEYANFQYAMRALDCGLSEDEVSLVFEHLQEDREAPVRNITVRDFGHALQTVPQEVRDLEAWNKGVLATLAESARKTLLGRGENVPAGSALRKILTREDQNGAPDPEHSQGSNLSSLVELKDFEQACAQLDRSSRRPICAD